MPMCHPQTELCYSEGRNGQYTSYERLCKKLFKDQGTIWGK